MKRLHGCGGSCAPSEVASAPVDAERMPIRPPPAGADGSRSGRKAGGDGDSPPGLCDSHGEVDAAGWPGDGTWRRREPGQGVLSAMTQQVADRLK